MATISLINRAWIIQIFTVNLSKATEEGEKMIFFGKDVIIWEFTYYLVTSMGCFALSWISFLKIISALPPSTLILSRKLLFHLLKGEEYRRRGIIQSQIHLSSLHLWCCSLSSCNLLHSGNLCRFLKEKHNIWASVNTAVKDWEKEKKLKPNLNKSPNQNLLISSSSGYQAAAI